MVAYVIQKLRIVIDKWVILPNENYKILRIQKIKKVSETKNGNVDAKMSIISNVKYR